MAIIFCLAAKGLGHVAGTACARPDGSGFSDFAETYAAHKLNARRYQHRLDSLGVKR